MTALTYRCSDGDMVDDICWRQYGKTDGVVEEVYKANPGLAGLGVVLSAGVLIELPVFNDATKSSTSSIVRLWT